MTDPRMCIAAVGRHRVPTQLSGGEARYCRAGLLTHFQDAKRGYYSFTTRAPPPEARRMLVSSAGFIPWRGRPAHTRVREIPDSVASSSLPSFEDTLYARRTGVVASTLPSRCAVFSDDLKQCLHFVRVSSSILDLTLDHPAPAINPESLGRRKRPRSGRAMAEEAGPSLTLRASRALPAAAPQAQASPLPRPVTLAVALDECRVLRAGQEEGGVRVERPLEDEDILLEAAYAQLALLVDAWSLGPLVSSTLTPRLAPFDDIIYCMLVRWWSCVAVSVQRIRPHHPARAHWRDCSCAWSTRPSHSLP